MNSAKRVLLAGVAVIAITVSLFLMRSQSSGAPDFETNISTQGVSEVIIEIPQGASGSQIGDILFDSGVIKSSLAYFRVAVSDVRSEKVAPGKHRLTLKLSARQALEQLLDSDRIPNLIKIFEGSWKSEISISLERYGFSDRQIEQGFAQLKLPIGFSDSEGLLFPAQYSFSDGITAPEAIQTMVDRFTKDATALKLLQGSDDFTPLQLLTIASIVQAEGDRDDFAKVSRVIRNRLEIGMPLQMDSTVHFIKKVRGEIFLSRNSTLLKSPYNTYQNRGLPPAPIGSPGVQAMQAAMAPSVGDWLYFITVAPGDTRFTKSIEQFNEWKSLYIKNRESGAFK